MSRPTSQHRLSVGAHAASLPVRTSAVRSHSHSVSNGSVGRINRRKSSTFAPSAAMSAAVETAMADPSIALKRRSSSTKAALAALNDVPYLSMPGSLPYAASGSAVVDGPSLSTFQGVEKMKPPIRRASDGTRLTKKEKAVSGELKCEHCGKAYKHGSCLNKHRWEHTPQWQVTSKLLISKHQQVQLLEAASVLVQMNGDGPADSDQSSPSPAASGSSDRDDDSSSAETTPPPLSSSSALAAVHGSYRDASSSNKRHSGASSAYSRSYQSAASENMFSASAHDLHGYAHSRHWSASSASRPATAATSLAESYRDEDPQDLAAAVGLLSCSYGGTPKLSAAAGSLSDVPPVPPLPAKYAFASSSFRSPSIPTDRGFATHAMSSRQQDVEMDDDDDEDDEEADGFSDDEMAGQRGYRRPHESSARESRYPVHHEDEEGVFGKMDA